MLIRLLFPFIMLLFSAYTSISYSDWQLDKQQSEISFIAIKNTNVADNHYFTDMDAHIDKTGQVILTVHTVSLQTNISKRDERLKSILFQVDTFPKAIAQLKVRRSYLKQQAPGSQKIINVKGKLNLLGISKATNARLLVTHLANGQVSVSTIEPILVDSEDYGMLQSINTLATIAGLKTISIKVPVSFNLVFSHQP